ncbi:hypothetical protein [Thermodesulfovibrio aggregans]|uniref:hypothetical protein n=1 Tax=Thermodesulfovibrio aggregans TaxID=86166 RepID=UPI000743A2A7|nr:hypothetical protein [Thermodesulfovibrio aggregans]
MYEKHREEATKEAFEVDRKLISKWNKRLKENGGSLEALVPNSIRPNRVRKSKVVSEIIYFIRSLIEKYLRLGKEKIKPLFLSLSVLVKTWSDISDFISLFLNYNLSFFPFQDE